MYSMGFCLFECAEPRSLYVAVNAAQVDEIKALDKKSCRLSLCSGPEDARSVDVLGPDKQVTAKLYEAAKIGFGKTEITILGGKADKLRPSQFLLNAPGRAVMVRDLSPEEFIYEDAEFVTVSQMTFEDGTSRLIVDRAGLFARKANAGGRVPMLVIKY